MCSRNAEVGQISRYSVNNSNEMHYTGFQISDPGNMLQFGRF